MKFRIPEQLLMPWHPRSSVSVRHTAELLDCSEDTILRYIEEGSLKAYQRLHRPGSPYRVYYESIVEFVERIHAEAGVEPRFQRE